MTAADFQAQYGRGATAAPAKGTPTNALTKAIIKLPHLPALRRPPAPQMPACTCLMPTPRLATCLFSRLPIQLAELPF
jgi:hypothetical protein